MVADKKEEIPLTEYAAGSYQSILKYPDVKVINEGQERVLPFQEICISIKMESDVSYEVSGKIVLMLHIIDSIVEMLINSLTY